MNTVLKSAREDTGLTQVAVANKIGVSEVSYQRYESEERIPNALTAIRIAQALGTTVEALFGAATPDSVKVVSALLDRQSDLPGNQEKHRSSRLTELM